MVNKNLLRSRIAEKGLTQAALAKGIGVSKNTISSKINNKTPFNTDEIDRICSLLDITECTEKAHIFLD